MKVAIACDHGGFSYKEQLIAHLQKQGFIVQDFGCFSEESVDYPDYAFAACKAVASGEYSKGILICGTGIGMSIAANKVEGIRCALCSEPVSAKLTREHNDTNVLAMGARMIGIEMAKNIADVWLSTAFSQDERHQRRIDKISNYKNN